MDTEIFFPVPPERGGGEYYSRKPEYTEEVARAQFICAQCPVRRECFAEAQRLGVRYGVWGGVPLSQRRAPSLDEFLETDAALAS
jgi:WhiB family redox-sensing transcriptional regulator